MSTVLSLIYAPSAVATLISVLIGLALLIPPRSAPLEPPAELVAAISGWPPPVVPAFPPPAPRRSGTVYISWGPPNLHTRVGS